MENEGFAADNVSMEYSTVFTAEETGENQSYLRIGLGYSLGSHIFNSI